MRRRIRWRKQHYRRPQSQLAVALLAASFCFSLSNVFHLRWSSDILDIDRSPEEFRLPSTKTHLVTDEKVHCNSTDSITNRRRHNVHVVVSHCDKSIGWIWRRFADEKQNQNCRPRDYDLKSVTIMSKCNVSVPLNDLPGIIQNESTSNGSLSTEPLVQVVSLPNAGRCDHSYAYWIKEVLVGTKGNRDNGEEPMAKNQTTPIYKLVYSSDGNVNNHQSNPFRKIARTIDRTDLVLFMKDNDNTYRGAIDDSIELPEVLDLLTQQEQPLPTTNAAGATNYAALKESHFSRPISRGMACQSYPNSNQFESQAMRIQHRFTNMAHRSVLWTFRLENYARVSRDSSNEPPSLLQRLLGKILGREEAYDPHGFQSFYRPMGSWIQHLAEPETDGGASLEARRKPQTVFSKDYYEQVVKSVVNRDHGYFYNITRYGLSSVIQDYRKNYLTRKYIETDLVPMCYGGVFATFWGQVASDDSPLTVEGWEVVTQALGRGDNLEEGHYMERWWGDLLSWSSFASTRTTASDPVVLQQEQQQHNEPVFSPHVKGVTLSKAEQALLLADKLRHMRSDNAYAGIVILDGDKLGREWAKAARTRT